MEEELYKYCRLHNLQEKDDKGHRFSQANFSDLVRDFALLVEKVEILESKLQSDIKVSQCTYR